MNLWDKGKSLLAVILLFTLCASCEENENTIGLPVENQLHLKYLEYEVPVEMVWVDSVRSGRLGAVYAGKFDLGEAGVVRAIPFLSFFPQLYDSNIAIPDGAVFKDFYLDLDYTVAVNRTINSTESIQVFQLADTIDSNRSHFIEDEAPWDEMIGEKTFTFIPDSLKLDQERDSVDYRERIDLDASIGEDLFNKLVQQDSATFYNRQLFSSAFKGLALLPAEENTAILGFSPAQSGMVITYEYEDEGTTKTGRFTFGIYSNYHNITPNKNSDVTAGAAFADIQCCHEGYQTTDELVYQLFGTGINIKFDLSAFKMFADSLNTVIINTATLELAGVESTSEFRNPPSQLAFYLTSPEGFRYTQELSGIEFHQTLQAEEMKLDPLRIGSPAVLNFDVEKELYRVNLTLYMQRLMEDPGTPDHLLLERAEMATIGNLRSLMRTASSISGITIPKNSIKIKLYYSTID